MLAGHITAPERIELVDIPERHLDPARPGEILFQPELACLCGSDLPYFDGEYGPYPLEIGYSLHEMIGTVVETTGEKFRPGDRVLAVPWRQHGFFERFPLTQERAIPLDPRPEPAHALLAQPLGTVLYALKKVGSVLDKDVVVLGQGPIGQMFCAVLRNLGARHIIAVEPVESRRRGSELGATHVLHPEEDNVPEAVADITRGHLADLVVEAVGHRHHVFNACAKMCRHAGEILVFGVPPEKIHDVAWLELFRKNITIHTSVDPDFARDFPLAMQWISEGRIDLRSLLTHHFPVSEIQTAFETFQRKREGAQKVLLEFPSYPGSFS